MSVYSSCLTTWSYQPISKYINVFCNDYDDGDGSSCLLLGVSTSEIIFPNKYLYCNKKFILNLKILTFLLLFRLGKIGDKIQREN